MPKSKYHVPFKPNQVYHCLNHVVGKELLFREITNYEHFLRLYKKYIAPISTTYAYCLMPNHFHFLLQIANTDQLKLRYQELKEIMPDEHTNWEKFIAQQFSNFFNAYAKAYNRKYARRGALFEDYIKRAEVSTNDYFLRTLRYIHLNPVQHGFADIPEQWQYNSYNAYIDSEKEGAYKKKILKRFGGIEQFIAYHREKEQQIMDMLDADLLEK